MPLCAADGTSGPVGADGYNLAQDSVAGEATEPRLVEPLLTGINRDMAEKMRRANSKSP